MTKYIFVTNGVVSGGDRRNGVVGSFGSAAKRIDQSDPYINVDPARCRLPARRELFGDEDGAKLTDLDLGTTTSAIDENLGGNNSITMARSVAP